MSKRVNQTTYITYTESCIENNHPPLCSLQNDRKRIHKLILSYCMQFKRMEKHIQKLIIPHCILYVKKERKGAGAVDWEVICIQQFPRQPEVILTLAILYSNQSKS